MTWKKAASVTELDAGPVVFNDSPKQIALFKTRGQVYAVDNRCPHEGYPLAQGHVDDNCILTCNWHNWKFRLQDGKCILGGDHVRSYPVKTENGDVWIDVEDPPPEQIQKTVIGALKTAFDDRDYGRICREITRLHYNQLDPTVAIRKAIEWSHDKFEFGFTHAYAASADWLGRSRIYMDDWEKQLVCLAEAVDHMAFDALRRPAFPFPVPGEGFDAEAFADAVETEQTARAEAMVQRGLLDGLHWEDMEQAFAEAALSHYNDFGHSLIYVYKAGQLLKLAGPELEPFILPSLTRHLCYTTREDLLPEFSEYASALESLPEISNNAGGNPVTKGFFPGTVRESSERLQTLASSHGAFSLFGALLTALARNTLHFDTSYASAYDRPVSQSVGWLGFTHGITFSNAVRNLCTKHPHLWRRGLLQMACFVGRNRHYLDLGLDASPWIVENQNAFFAEIHKRVLDHGLRDPIFSAHLLKTAVAVEEEVEHASDPCAKYLLAALNRFFHSPLKQKHTRRLARQAIDLVSRDFKSPARDKP